MLPNAHRLRSSSDFKAVTRSGRRARRGYLVVYLLPCARTGEFPATLSSGACSDSPESGADTSIRSARVGLVVGKPVGGSVVRHQVSRRLRAQLSARLDRIPVGARVVVRALPGAATAGSHQLGQDLDRALSRILRETDSSR